MGVHAKGEGRVRVAEPGRDDVNRDMLISKEPGSR
jgi:hypothetical protein